MTLLVSAGSQACSSGTGRNPVPSLCVQVIRARARSWSLGGDRGWRSPLHQTHTVPLPPGAAPGILAGRTVHPGNPTTPAAGRAAGGSRQSPSPRAVGCLVVSCARLPRMPACRGPRADLPAPGALESPAPPPAEVVLHPRCPHASRPAGGPRGRRGGSAGRCPTHQPGSSPKTLPPSVQPRPAPAATLLLGPGLSRKDPSG